MLTLKYNGTTYAKMTVEQLREHGVPETEIDGALYAARLASLSAECRRRIYAVATAETQMNMASAASLISAKTAAQRTDDEAGVLVGLQTALDWVQAMRGAVVVLAENPDADHMNDASWPDAPAAAVAVAGQF